MSHRLRCPAITRDVACTCAQDEAVTEVQPRADASYYDGKPLPNRADRRRWAREAARQLNHSRRRRVVAIQREDD